ncbi:hypothetical protein B0T26DRAFT_299779 [Lasiosphaeria miniovina]|uniref:Uncharacterized protein n=1 Tax=Lasiosphaeria miniovina TaxID=1954250 RepID=A0AA40AKN3_9PEZI|nr:uncharacterized protein B0T26DRAFT_299779 [Lasiosphaeria miniovina]KAK0717595.1 hypothetical protein B0T26DRAFT_299779 [Lasiosphaeria miniovina]
MRTPRQARAGPRSAERRVVFVAKHARAVVPTGPPTCRSGLGAGGRMVHHQQAELIGVEGHVGEAEIHRIKSLCVERCVSQGCWCFSDQAGWASQTSRMGTGARVHTNGFGSNSMFSPPVLSFLSTLLVFRGASPGRWKWPSSGSRWLGGEYDRCPEFARCAAKALCCRSRWSGGECSRSGDGRKVWCSFAPAWMPLLFCCCCCCCWAWCCCWCWAWTWAAALSRGAWEADDDAADDDDVDVDAGSKVVVHARRDLAHRSHGFPSRSSR